MEKLMRCCWSVSLLYLTLLLVGGCNGRNLSGNGASGAGSLWIGSGNPASPYDHGLRSSADLPLPDLVESPLRKYDPGPRDLNTTELRLKLGTGFHPGFMSVSEPLSPARNRGRDRRWRGGGVGGDGKKRTANGAGRSSPSSVDLLEQLQPNGSALLVGRPGYPPWVADDARKLYSGSRGGGRNHLDGARRRRRRRRRRRKKGVRTPGRRRLRRLLLSMTHCPVRWTWKDVGVRFWPRWIKEGRCGGEEGDSAVDGGGAGVIAALSAKGGLLERVRSKKMRGGEKRRLREEQRKRRRGGKEKRRRGGKGEGRRGTDFGGRTAKKEKDRRRRGRRPGGGKRLETSAAATNSTGIKSPRGGGAGRKVSRDRMKTTDPPGLEESFNGTERDGGRRRERRMEGRKRRRRRKESIPESLEVKEDEEEEEEKTGVENRSGGKAKRSENEIPMEGSCSIPPGMVCRPAYTRTVTLLRWHCKEWRDGPSGYGREGLTSAERTEGESEVNSNEAGVAEEQMNCRWIKVEYPIVTRCACVCPD